MQSFTRFRLSLLALTVVVAQALPCLAAQPVNGHPFTAYHGVGLEFATLVSLGNDEGNAGSARPVYDATRDFGASGQVAQFNVPRDVAGQKGASLVPRQCNLNSFDPKIVSLETRVSYAFCLVLGRLPDATGLQFWTAHLKRPIPVSEMLEGMAASDEFRTLNRLDTLNNEDFLAMVYKRFLLREPDGGGAATYVAELASGRVDRRAIIKGFIESHEFAVRHPILSAPLQ